MIENFAERSVKERAAGVEVDGAFEALLCVLDVAGLLFGEGVLEVGAGSF